MALCIGVSAAPGRLAHASWSRPYHLFFKLHAAMGLCPTCVVPRLLPLQNGNTALMRAADEKHLNVVEALVKAGANVDLQNMVNTALTAGRTPRAPRVPWFWVGRSFEKCSFCVREGERLKRSSLLKRGLGRGAVHWCF